VIRIHAQTYPNVSYFDLDGETVGSHRFVMVRSDKLTQDEYLFGVKCEGLYKLAKFDFGWTPSIHHIKDTLQIHFELARLIHSFISDYRVMFKVWINSELNFVMERDEKEMLRI